MRLSERFSLLLCALFLGPISTPAGGQEADYPDPVGYVNDFAQVISSDYERTLTELIAEVEQKTTAEIAVATVKTGQPQSIDMYAVELFTRWGVGKEEKDNGVLIVLAMEERKVWIEVGYGLEGVLPDGFCGEVYRQLLVPHFQQGEFGKGLLVATTAIGQKIGKEYGVEIGGTDPVLNLGAKPKPTRLVPVLGMIMFSAFILLVFVSRMGLLGPVLFGSVHRRGYWTRGTFGGGGGFSGGFGGFGGGSCGGGGAGGGW